jgi:hypothetical protein
MNWDALGAVAELVGSAAVILTLIYLAMQIRQSSNIASAEASRDSTKIWDDALQDMIRNNATMLPALKNLAVLDQDARYAVVSRIARLIQAHGIMWQQSELGVASEQTLAIADKALASVLTTPGGRAYWAKSGAFWIHPDHVDRMIQSYEGPSWVEFFDEFERHIAG